jgi:hypothetical protein
MYFSLIIIRFAKSTKQKYKMKKTISLNSLSKTIFAISFLFFLCAPHSCSEGNKTNTTMPPEIIGTWASYPAWNNLIGNRFTISSNSFDWYQWVKGYESDGDGDECDLTEVLDNNIIYTNCGLYYKWRVEADTIWLHRDFEIQENIDDWHISWRMVRE